ncbi:DNA repair protein RecO [Primorskyibacter sp. S187A]|uniref:DNA repair protein RecO n=1 Tax=Primorskyibacter sp. S187A TaxID=3415130 RepID=UPI003C7AAE99
MEWRDEGFLLSARRHGETAAILEVFTPARGRHAGVLRGGASRKMAPHLQPGTQLDVIWKARLEDHLGSFTVEPVRARTAVAMHNRRALAGLNAVCALLLFCLPERDPLPDLYRRSEQLLDLMGQDDLWPLAYLNWELALLDALGYGLDLSACAVTGQTEDLTYVSPKSGRAVSRQGAGDWADKLLPLPPCLLGQGEAPDAEIAQALGTTGYFFGHKVARALGTRPIPEARARFAELLTRPLSPPRSQSRSQP